jgi:hypothetical protein
MNSVIKKLTFWSQHRSVDRVQFPVQWVVQALCLRCGVDPSIPCCALVPDWAQSQLYRGRVSIGNSAALVERLVGYGKAVKLLGRSSWRRIIGFYYIISVTKFSEYKVTEWKCEGFNHIIKATEALCGKGACLLFIRNMVLVVVKCSAFICDWKIFSYRNMFQSNLLASSHFQSLVLSTRSLYGVLVTWGVGITFLCKMQ